MLEPVRVDGLAMHLEDRYGVEVANVAQLDLGVLRVDLRDGSRWVARVFAARRPVGIANVMVMAVMQRRREIGLRRALGATRRQIAIQFSAEALIMSALGGIAGIVIGILITASYAHARHWSTTTPPTLFAGALAAALVVGLIAGLYPAARAARLSPTDALRTAI